MLILSVHSSYQDTSAALFNDYDVLGAIQKERQVRSKGAGGDPTDCIDAVLRLGGVRIDDIDHVTFSRGLFPLHTFRTQPQLNPLAPDGMGDLGWEMSAHASVREHDAINRDALVEHYGFRPDVEISYFDHHAAHAVPAYFFTKWDEALVVSADGGGDNANYSCRHFTSNGVSHIWKEEGQIDRTLPVNGLAQAYGYVTEALGFRPRRHEGKLTGLAAHGEATLLDEYATRFAVDEHGRIGSTFADYEEMKAYFVSSTEGQPPENVARSIQDLTQAVMVKSVNILLEKTQASKLGLSGGLFSNVKLNQALLELTPAEEIFIFPPMGDEGLVIGGGLLALLQRDGYSVWRDKRYRLSHLYWGEGSNSAEDVELERFPGIEKVAGNGQELAAEKLASGSIVAIFHGRTEYGPRALGARSILASPVDARINDELNTRLDRTEFMPFAPVVRKEIASSVFEITKANEHACRFMTITCGVKEDWIKKIPAVVHVDQTARPQIIDRVSNPLYYDVLMVFERLTKTPVLINTSFNAHEEPIINTPIQAVQALSDGRVDYILTSSGLYRAVI